MTVSVATYIEIVPSVADAAATLRRRVREATLNLARSGRLRHEN